MLTRLWFALGFAVFAPFAHAQADLPFLPAAETRYGPVAIAPADLQGFAGQQVAFDGVPVAGTADALVDIRSVLPHPGGAAADWVLVSLASGGNGCPTLWAVVEVSAGAARASEHFGTCSEEALMLRTEGGALILDLTSFEAGIERVRYRWDGTALAETPLPFSDAGAVPAGGGDEVTRWIGEHPTRPFDVASERLRFGTIMTADEVFELAARVSVADVVGEAEGFVIGQGFLDSSGGEVSALWGIRIADGRPFAIFRATGVETRAFGLSSEPQAGLIPEAEIPRIARDFMEPVP